MLNRGASNVLASAVSVSNTFGIAISGSSSRVAARSAAMATAGSPAARTISVSVGAAGAWRQRAPA